MNEIDIQIRPAKEPQRAATAWFIAGGDPGVWLAELGRWAIPLDAVRLYVLPESRAERSPAGVLAVPPAGLVPAQIVRAEAYGQHSPRLYLPVQARFDPPVTEREIDDDLPSRIAVWCPSAGLIGFDESDVLSVADLLQSPAQRTVEIGRAHV